MCACALIVIVTSSIVEQQKARCQTHAAAFKENVLIRSCPFTPAREGAQIPLSHPPPFPLARWSLRMAASDSLLPLHLRSLHDELDWVWVIACA
jgi:hypothetical protein